MKLLILFVLCISALSLEPRYILLEDGTIYNNSTSSNEILTLDSLLNNNKNISEPIVLDLESSKYFLDTIEIGGFYFFFRSLIFF